LLHENGSCAHWFFDGNGHQYNVINDWPAPAWEAFVNTFKPVVTLLLSSPQAGILPPLLAEFLSLRPSLRQLITAALQPVLFPEPRHIHLDDSEAATPPWAAAGPLKQCLAINLQQRFVEAMRSQELRWPSPVSGQEMRCTGAISLDNFSNLYRFRETLHGFDYFILTSEHLARVGALFVPLYGAVITLNHDQSKIFRQHFTGLSARLLRHFALFAESWCAGLMQPAGPQRFATFLRDGGSAHLGHQLWNELAAADALCAALPRRYLPVWLIPGTAETDIEFYGRIETLFPELGGGVQRGLPDHAAITRYAYENGLILFRAAREYISETLRARVITLAATRAPPLPAASFTILIGLRVENRTATDLAALCTLILDEAVRLYPGCTVIFDGHNARGTERGAHIISSYREDAASESPIDVERRLADLMRDRFSQLPIQILDTLGEPLATSLLWSHACDGFIALWGAGLAKYRWVANKPGLIITSRWNLQNKADLNIYETPRYMADPTPVTYVPAEVIEDQPAAPMLVPFEQPSYFNFTYDDAAMRQHVSAFLRARAAPAR